MFNRLVIFICLFALLLSSTATTAAAGPVTLGMGTLSDLALSPNGAALAVSTSLGVYFFDAQGLGQTHFWATPETARAIAWSPDGLSLALATYWQLELRDAATGAMRWTQPIWTCWYCDASQPAFSADGKLVLLSGSQRGSQAYYIATGQVAAYQTFYDVQQWAASVAPHAASNSRLGRTRFVATVDNFAGRRGVGLYENGVLHSFYETRYDHALALSPNGARLALADESGKIVVWWTNDRLRPVVEFRAQGGLNPRLAFSPDGRVLFIAASNVITSWSTETGQEVAPRLGFTAPVSQVAWSPDGRQVIGAQGPHLGAWDVASRMPVKAGALAASQPDGWSLLDLQLSPSGDYLATDWSGGFSLYDGDTYAEIYHRFTGRTVRASAFSPDGRLLATGGAGPFVNIWDSATGRPVLDLMTTYTNQGIMALAFSRDGQSLLALEHHGLLWTFDLATGAGTTVRTPDPCPACWYYYDPIIDAANRRVIVERRHDIAISDMDTGELLVSATVERPHTIILSASGTRLAAIVAGGVIIWEVSSGRLLTTIAEDLGYRGDIAFSPDGTRLAIASSNGTVHLWPVP